MKKATSLALLISAVSGQSLAETSISRDAQLKLSGVVVTASREAESIEDSTAAVTVFTREDIDRLQPSTVLELLRQAPGIHVTHRGGRGSNTGVYMRGTANHQFLVLIDGQRSAAASAGATALETLSPDQIERIEVLRGARSAIYGADAIGGVIQIFTRRGEGDGLNPRVRLAYGSREIWERSAGISGGDKDTRFSLNISSDDTNGIDRTDDSSGPSADKDAYRNTSVSAHLSHHFSERVEAGASVLRQEGETEYDSGSDFPYDQFKVTNISAYSVVAITHNWQTRFELGRNDNDNINRMDNDPLYRTHYLTTRYSAAWLNSFQLTEAQTLRVGFDWYEDKLDAEPAMPEENRWNRGVYLQHRFQSDSFGTEVGARYDDNEVYGDVTTLSGAVTAPIGAANTLTLSYSEGFRAPTFNDLYSPWGSNPNLKPEESQNLEALWRSELRPGLYLQASLYRNEIDNAIVLDSSWVPYNVGHALFEGAEASLEYRDAAWTASVGLNFLRAKDKDADEDFIRRPRRTVQLSLDRHWGPFSFGGTFLGVSSVLDERWDEATYTTVPVRLSGYGLLNLRANWNVTPEVNLALKVDNVFDRDYTTIYSYAEEGRTALVSVTWTPVL